MGKKGKRYRKFIKKEVKMEKSTGEVEMEKSTGIVAYCMKCKAKRVIKDPKQITHSNGRAAVTGVCSVCGTKIFRMGKMTGSEIQVDLAFAAEQRPDDWGKMRSKIRVS